MKENLEKMLSMFSNEKGRKTKSQNLIFALILLVFTLICINSIFKKDSVETISHNGESDENSNNLQINNYNNIEESLTKILNEIEKVSEASVMLTYSNYEQIVPVYDIKEETSVEEDSDGDVKKSTKKTTTEKTVAYEEDGGEKVAIVESKKSPQIIGAIITAKGIDSSNLVKIKEAVSNALDIPVYKIEVFSK